MCTKTHRLISAVSKKHPKLHHYFFSVCAEVREQPRNQFPLPTMWVFSLGLSVSATVVLAPSATSPVQSQNQRFKFRFGGWGSNRPRIAGLDFHEATSPTRRFVFLGQGLMYTPIWTILAAIPLPQRLKFWEGREGEHSAHLELPHA